MDKTQPKGAGDYTLKAGQSITLKYRILIMQGEASEVREKTRFEEYAKSVR